MKVTFENPDKINGVMTIVIEENDYAENLTKRLKDIRKKTEMPGFRKGMVPMGRIKQMYGTSVKIEEINKLVGDSMYGYVRDNKIEMLGEPVPSEKQVPQDLDNNGPFEFIFDIAVAPEFEIKLDKRDKLTYYHIDIDDKLIDQQIDMFRGRTGHNEEVEDYQENDILTGDLRELNEDGSNKEDGIVLSDAKVMPSYIKAEDQKKLFDGAKKGDIITFNPKKAYENVTELSALMKIEKEQAENLTADFTFQVTGISRYVKGEINQELFDATFGKDEVKSEEEFRNKIKETLEPQVEPQQDLRLLLDLKKKCEDKIGKLEYPEALLKRIMLDGANAEDKNKAAEEIEKEFANSIEALTWHLIKNKLVTLLDVKIDDNDIKNASMRMARDMFAQYGMSNMPEEYVEKYAQEMMGKEEMRTRILDNAIDEKIVAAIKTTITIDDKNISFEDFNKLFA